MPGSSEHNLTPVCGILRAMSPKPRTTLDIGVGLGKFGLLVREYVDVFGTEALGEHKTYLVGVEAFAPYVQPWHRSIYDELHIGDIRDLRAAFGHFDLILAIDVVEHFGKDEAIDLLEWIASHSTEAIVAIPVVPSPQGAAFGNEYERHRTAFTEVELRPFGDVQVAGGQYILHVRGVTAPRSGR